MHPRALHFTLKRPPAPEALKHLIRLQHDRALDFIAFVHQIRPAHQVAALEGAIFFLHNHAGPHKAPPRDFITEQIGPDLWFKGVIRPGHRAHLL
jgi:hypothetical protein